MLPELLYDCSRTEKSNRSLVRIDHHGFNKRSHRSHERLHRVLLETTNRKLTETLLSPLLIHGIALASRKKITFNLFAPPMLKI